MRYLIISALLGILSCASIPSQDIVIHFSTVDGPRFLEIPEGSLDEQWHGISWWMMEEHLDNIKDFLMQNQGRQNL